ncbi:MAG: hypothetical protein LUC16_03280 [Coprobacillus sp.]|nr:hypothetical protein [Coprobacillus sp.]
MKRKGLYLSSMLLLTGVTSLSGCSASTSIYSASKARSLTSEEKENINELSLMEGLLDFSYKYSVGLDYNDSYNSVVSPISIYMCLAELCECTASTTQQEILTALGVNSLDELREGISTVYNSLIRSVTASSNSTKPNTVMSKFLLSNSIWLDTDFHNYNSEVLENLAQSYYTSSFNVDFYGNNKKANKEITEYVSESTNGLINHDFNYNIYSEMVLLNTIYYKDCWNGYGNSLTQRVGYNDTFTNGRGEINDVTLYQTSYRSGQPLDREKYTSFYTKTYGGYTLHFILPKDEVSLSEIYTYDTIKEVLTATSDDYKPKVVTTIEDEENDVLTIKTTYYETRCLFPAFSATSEVNPIAILEGEAFGINEVFTKDADMSALFPYAAYPIYVDQLDQITTLTVNGKGIEATSVTAAKSNGNGMSAAVEYQDEHIFLEYPVDRAFMYVITSPYDIPLFSGYINNA